MWQPALGSSLLSFTRCTYGSAIRQCPGEEQAIFIAQLRRHGEAFTLQDPFVDPRSKLLKRFAPHLIAMASNPIAMAPNLIASRLSLVGCRFFGSSRLAGQGGPPRAVA